jgi:hypothetical protein
LKRKIRILAEFERCLGRIIYNGNYFSSVVLRPSFLKLFDLLKKEEDLEVEFDLLLSTIPSEHFKRLFIHWEEYFKNIYSFKRNDILIDIPGHSLHPYLDPEDFKVDYIFSNNGKQYAEYAEIIQPEAKDKFISIPSYFPEMNFLTSRRFKKQLFAPEEEEEFIQEFKKAEEDWIAKIYYLLMEKKDGIVSD